MSIHHVPMPQGVFEGLLQGARYTIVPSETTIAADDILRIYERNPETNIPTGRALTAKIDSVSKQARRILPSKVSSDDSSIVCIQKLNMQVRYS